MGCDIAFFMHGFEWGGAQKRTIRLAAALAEAGLGIALLVAEDGGPLRAEVPESVPVIDVGGRLAKLPWVRGKRRRRTRAAVPGLARWLHSEKPKLLVGAANHSLLATIAAHRLAAEPEVKLALRVSNHLSGPGFSRWLRAIAVRRSFNRADAVIAVAEAVARDLKALHPGLRVPLRVLPNPVIDADLPRRAAAPPAHPWFADGGAPVILSVGRLAPQKDIPTLLAAFARLSHEARLVVVGDGPERARLEALAVELGIAARVSFTGALADPFPLMAAARLFVLSSRWEGLPGALIEAMACGCAVVSTDCPGGSAEILEGGRLGALTPPGDASALAAAIDAALAADPDPEALKARAAAFSVEAAVAEMLDLYRSLTR